MLGRMLESGDKPGRAARCAGQQVLRRTEGEQDQDGDALPGHLAPLPRQHLLQGVLRLHRLRVRLLPGHEVVVSKTGMMRHRPRWVQGRDLHR